MTAATDLELVDRWRGGDAAAAEELTARYYRSVLRFFELKLPRAAQDLTQQVFLACIEGQQRYRGTGTFKAYLFGIARHVLLEQIRRAEGKLTRFDEDDDAPDVTGLSTLIARRQEQQLVLQALVAVDADALVEIQLYYWEGLGTREIGEILALPPSTVTTHLARSRARLRRELELLTVPGSLRQRVLADIEGLVRGVAVTDAPDDVVH
ncbi:MAG: sigma-70 family RNA polymerase sigma factor [Myxococcota bacterium]